MKQQILILKWLWNEGANNEIANNENEGANNENEIANDENG